MNRPARPHRPSYQDSATLEALGDRVDPIERLHAAHETAAALVAAGHQSTDPELTRRLVGVVEDIGLPTLADLWEARPARSLPGALYRLYVLREWIRTHADEVAREFDAGRDAPHAWESTTTPVEVSEVANEILHGVFTGDVAEALDRAARCCLTIAAGRTTLASGGLQNDRADKLRALGTDLAAAATLHREGRLE